MYLYETPCTGTIIKGSFEARYLKPRPLDPWIFYLRVIIALIYVDYVLFFDHDQYNIDEVIKELEDGGTTLTI